MGCREGLAQTVGRVPGHRRHGDERRHRHGRRRVQDADFLRQSWLVLPGKHVPVGVQRPDVDTAVRHTFEDAPRGDEIADGAAVEARTVLASVRQQMMSQRVEARLRVGDGPAHGTAEGVGEVAIGRIFVHDQVGPGKRFASGPGRRGNGRCQGNDIGEVERDRVSAHLDATDVVAPPELLERARRRVGNVVERRAGVLGDVGDELLPGRFGFGAHGVHPCVGYEGHGQGSPGQADCGT